jgi:DNA-3-methyladenine glycosylase
VRRFDSPPGARERARLRELLSRPTPEAARGLIGQVLVRLGAGAPRAVRIVEAEAYLGADDPAAHVFGGPTPRTAPLFGDVGVLYVYLVYGMHHCLNLAVDRPGVPGCVLIRGAEPLPGSTLAPEAGRGPGRLCRALEIDRSLSGRHLFEADPPLTLREGTPAARVETSPRVGIRRAAERALRFFDPASPAVSSRGRGGVTSAVARGRSTPDATRPGARRKNP